jgi:hypothetical protein
VRKKKQQLKAVDSPLFNYWQAFYMSLYSDRLYIDVLKRWSGFGMMYFLLLVTLLSVPVSFLYVGKLAHYIDDNLIYPIENMPLIILQDGQASIDEPMPYFVKSRQGEDIIEIDTTAGVKKFSKKNKSLILLLTKDSLKLRLPSVLTTPNNKQEFDPQFFNQEYSQNYSEIFSGRRWLNASGLKHTVVYAAVFVYVGIIGILFSIGFLLNLVLSSIGRIISTLVLKYPVSFKESVRLAFIASTGPFTLLVILHCMGLDSRAIGGPWYIALVACYFSFAIISVKRESKFLVWK